MQKVNAKTLHEVEKSVESEGRKERAYFRGR